MVDRAVGLRRGLWAAALCLLLVSCGGPPAEAHDAGLLGLDAGPLDYDTGPLEPDAGERPLTLSCGAGLSAARLTGEPLTQPVNSDVSGIYDEGHWVVEWMALDPYSGWQETRIGSVNGLEMTLVEAPADGASFWLSRAGRRPPRRVVMDDSDSLGRLVFSERRWLGDSLSVPERTVVLDDPAWRFGSSQVCVGERFSAHLLQEREGDRLGLAVVDWRGERPALVGEPYLPPVSTFSVGRPLGIEFTRAEVAGCVERGDGEFLVGVLRGGLMPQPLLVHFRARGGTTLAPVGSVSTVARLFQADGKVRYFVANATEGAMYDGEHDAPLATTPIDGVFLSAPRLLQIGHTTMVPTAGWLMSWDEETHAFAPPLRIGGNCSLYSSINRQDGDALELIAPCGGGFDGTGFALHRVRLCGETP